MLSAVLVVALLAVVEARTSWIQSRVVSTWAAEIDYEVAPGRDSVGWQPPQGPYDVRLGYARLPDLIASLEEHGYAVREQARVSPRFRKALELGLYPVYPEKSRTGLTIVDHRGDPLYESMHPERVYAAFDSIPPLVAGTLLFIENRELLLARSPNRNPAIEWDRLAGSVASLLARRLGATGSVAGASTLATQIEKFRHSPGGLTRTPTDKLRQMGTATVRAYASGRATAAERQRIVLAYLNSVPLAAVRGYGEVLGLQDGLVAWYGLDPARVNELLRDDGDVPADSAAIAYRAVLGLMLAQRRPAFYLMDLAGQESLDRLTNVYLGLLRSDGIISRELETAARAVSLLPGSRFSPPDPAPFIERKASTAARTRLLNLLGTDRLYDVDRYDMAVRTTIDRAVQDSVTRILLRLADTSFVRSAGLVAPRLLASGDPARVTYSFLLYESGPEANELRVLTDNFDGPFDLNQSSRLELGSTAKLRTLVTFLEIAERLHGELAGLEPDARRDTAARFGDPLTRWAAEVLARRPDATLAEFLDEAMERRYSGNPSERFFTGGGTHVFQNFDNTYDGSILSVRESFERSVNLPFVRIMRDIERFYRARLPAGSRLLSDPTDPQRQVYLERFADREGSQFVSRFFARYAGMTRGEILHTLASGRRLNPLRMSWAYRSVVPDATEAELATYLNEQSPDARFTEQAVRDLFRRADAERLILADRGYLAGIHPLELWVARYRIEHPDADRARALEASARARQEVYRWLFDPRRRAAQDRSISILVEIEAFLDIQRAWRRLGYPFENVVPSYGTAVGSSGDRPGALAELVGILLNDGLRLPVAQISRIELGLGTPYETRLALDAPEPERVLSREVARTAKSALLDVVGTGTAQFVRGSIRDASGAPIAIGGKTGTGNNQFKVFGAGGRLIDARTINRTATFAFFIGDRWFGVITAHVGGDDASSYAFTSALPLRVFSLVAPALQPVLGEVGPAETAAVGSG